MAPEKFQENPTRRMPQVIVACGDMAWTMVVTDPGTRKWLATNNVLEAWMEISIIADKVNKMIAKGEPSPATCICTPEAKSAQTHDCGRYGRKTPCERLEDHPNGYRACEACHGSVSGIRSTFERAREMTRTLTR